MRQALWLSTRPAHIVTVEGGRTLMTERLLGRVVLRTGFSAEEGCDGMRAFWEKIPERELRAARARAGALLDPLRAADGRLRRGLRFCRTPARVPGGT